MNFRCSISIFFSALCVLISVIFSVFCIYLLFEERKEVGIALISSDELKIHDKLKYPAMMKSNYDLSDEEGARMFQMKLQNYRYEYHKLNLEKLLCVPLNAIEIFQNQSELLLERMGDDLADHLNQTFYRSLQSEHPNANEIKQNLKIFDLTVLRFFRSKSYYILRDKLCLILDYLWYTEFYLERLFRPRASSYMLIKDSHYVVRLKKFNDAFGLRLIYNHNNPNLNCSINLTEFECLNGCLKEKHRFSKYFYNGNETGLIQLPAALSNTTARKLVAEHEAGCFEKCDEELCVVTDFQSKNSEDKHSNSSNNSIVSNNSNNLIKVSLLEFKPLLNGFAFGVQLTGLTLSFFGVSCYNLFLKLTATSLPQNKKLVNALFKLLLWTACVTLFLILSKESVANYSKKHSGRTAKTSLSFSRQPEQIGLVVCVPVGPFLNGTDSEKMTFSELELATNDAFYGTIFEMYLEFLNKRYEVEWKMNETKVLFNANDYTSELGRCFQVDIQNVKEEPEYHSIWSELKLVITFKKPSYELYVLPENQQFNYNSFRFDPNKTTKLNKIVFKSSPLKCVDYKEEYASCDSRWNCLDECVVNKSIEYDLDIPILHVIDKNKGFDSIDWSDYSPNNNLKGNPRVEDECREEISSPDCYKIFFERDVSGGSNFGADWRKVKIDLYHTVLLKTAADDSGYDVLLDLLNIVQIFWDLQALKLLTAVVLFFRVKVFEWHFVTKKLFLYPIYLLCLIGLALHVLFIFDQVQNSRLVFSNYYEALKFQPMPELNFCFEHDGWNAADKELNLTGELSEDQTGYESGLLTGDHLERATNDIRTDTVFSSIRYLSTENGSNGWVDVNLTGMPTNEARFQRQGVVFERFYFSDKKCLSIRTNQSYHRSRFYFEDTFDGSYEVMRLNFNRSFLESDSQTNRLIVFYSRTNKRYLSEIKFLNYTSPEPGSEHSKISYKILQEHFEIINNDKFRLAKNPLLYGTERFSNVGKYMGDLMKRFRKEHNVTTLQLPLTEEYFGFRINDTLFDQLNSLNLTKKPTNNPTQPDSGWIYERKIIENLVEKHFYGADKPDFKIHLKFGKFKQVFRTKENLAKFILNLLNGLSLWLSISFFQTFVLKSGFFGRAKTPTEPGTPEERPNDDKIGGLNIESDFSMGETSYQSRYNSL